MKPQRTLYEVINLLMALLFIIPLGVFVEQVTHWPLFHCCFIPCFAAVGFLLGRFSMARPMQAAMVLSGVGFVVGTAGALILSLVLGLGLAGVLLTILTAFFSLFFFFSARKAAYTIYAPMAVSGILIHLVILLCCEGFGWGQNVSRFTSAVAIGYFLLTLFAFSAKGLRRSMHRGSGEKRVVYPAGMQMGNFLLVTGFILVAAFISNIHPIFNVFSKAFAVVLRVLFAVLAFISSLFDRRTVSMAGVEEEESAVPVDSEDNIMAYDPKGEASWVTQAVEIFAFICVLLVIIYALYKLMKKLRESGVRLPAFLQRMKDRFAPVAEEDYVDENESLFDMKQMLSDMRGNMAGALKKLRDRPQKLEDFPDDRMKLRFVFQQMLKRVKQRNPKALSSTPNEIYRKEYDGEPDFRQFMDYYNLAKYSDAPIPEDAGELAKAILKQKL